MELLFTLVPLVFGAQFELLSAAGHLVVIARDMPANGLLGWSLLATALGLVVTALLLLARKLDAYGVATRFPRVATGALSVAPIVMASTVALMVR